MIFPREQNEVDSEAAMATPLPLAEILPFRSFNNRYAGRACYVIGRGKTDFDYRQLSTINDPIFFINDAVCLECFTRGETFFFAHDSQLFPWLDGRLQSTAVLPIDGKMFRHTPGYKSAHSGRAVFYSWPYQNKESLLKMTRDELAEIGQLYVHTGTIHSVIHFIWYCGFTQVNLIGCDGISRTSGDQTPDAPGGHDPRLENRSQSWPDWDYSTIRRAQDLLISLFGLTARYVGTQGE